MRAHVSVASFARTFCIVFFVSLGAIDILARMFTGGSVVGPSFTAEVAAATEPIMPARLTIESLGIDAAVEHVGKNENGNMAVPSSYSSTAWYELGSRPGEEGNAVIAGHRDNSLGLPGVFSRLEAIAPGAAITVADAAGRTLHYVVRKVERYPYSAAPLTTIFATQGRSQLVLITCDGEWDPSARSYKDRLVVYASLAS